MSSWVNPTNYTPDYFNSCVTNSNCGVPINYYGNQIAQSGSGYVGIITGGPGAPFPGVREYIQATLSSSLQANALYSVTINISIADSVKYITNSIGGYFSNNIISSNDNYVLPYSPQVNFTNINTTTSKTLWTSLTGSFVAQGGEKYITIGNFLDDNISTIDSFPNVGNYIGGFSYLYLDNISVMPITTGLSNIKSESLLMVNPTITDDFVEVESSQEINTIKIISIIGTVISETQTNTKKIRLNISNLNNGIYYLQINFAKEGILQKKRIIINR